MTLRRALVFVEESFAAGTVAQLPSEDEAAAWLAARPAACAKDVAAGTARVVRLGGKLRFVETADLAFD